MKINIHRECEIEPTIRTELLSSMFEVPTKQKLSVTLTGESEHDRGSRDYNIGLIVGPSGSGKTILLESLFGRPKQLQFSAKSVIDDFPTFLSMEDISRVCQSVGFNTIPSWLRPFSVLSNGERFRVETARHLLESVDTDIITMDEFTSVVDRQVAQFACHAIQRYVRASGKKLVVASCHYDIIEWLQPDWILEPGNPCQFTWRSLHSRPPIECTVSRVKYETWQLFRDFHYMSADLHKAARCYGLFICSFEYKHKTAASRLGVEDINGHVRSQSDGDSRISGDSGCGGIPGYVVSECEFDSSMVLCQNNELEDKRSVAPESGEAAVYGNMGVSESDNVGLHEPSQFHQTSRTGTNRIASMCGVLFRPHPKVRDIFGFTRMVTLPDFQGLGLAFVLACKVASAYKALGKRLHSYPNHPAWIRSYQRSKDWMQIKSSGSFSPSRGKSSSVEGFGGRRCAVFQYIGDAMSRDAAERLINVD